MLGLLSRGRKPATAASRVARSVGAREALGEDFFGGWLPEDVALFEAYADRSVATAPGFIVDFLGVRTRVDFVPWAAGLAGSRLAEPPVPDDCVHAEAIEYFALLSA